MKRYTIPMTILSTATVTAPSRHAAIVAARDFVSDAAPEHMFIRGYNDTSKLNNEPAIIMDISGFDVETVNGDEVETNPAFIIVAQRDLHEGTDYPGTNFSEVDEDEATQWAVYQFSPGSGDIADDLVEDYPTRAAAEACVKALEYGEPVPTPEWPSAAPEPVAPLDIAPELAAVVERLVKADAIPDAETFAAAMRDAGDLLARLGINLDTKA